MAETQSNADMFSEYDKQRLALFSQNLAVYEFLRASMSPDGLVYCTRPMIEAAVGDGGILVGRAIRRLINLGAVKVISRGQARSPSVYRLGPAPQCPVPTKSEPKSPLSVLAVGLGIEISTREVAVRGYDGLGETPVHLISMPRIKFLEDQ